ELWTDLAPLAEEDMAGCTRLGEQRPAPGHVGSGERCAVETHLELGDPRALRGGDGVELGPGLGCPAADVDIRERGDLTNLERGNLLAVDDAVGDGLEQGSGTRGTACQRDDGLAPGIGAKPAVVLDQQTRRAGVVEGRESPNGVRSQVALV